MASDASGLVQGTLHMLILKTLTLEPLHGYGIAMRIQQVSEDLLKLNQGTLYPALLRLEQAVEFILSIVADDPTRRNARGVLGEFRDEAVASVVAARALGLHGTPSGTAKETLNAYNAAILTSSSSDS